jgi:hypothetical protein
MALAGLRKGTEEIRKAAESTGGGRFTPFIGWKDGDVKLIHFLTPAQEIPKVRLHTYVEIPTDDGETRYDTFVCRKDPAFREESGNTCKLCDEIGHTATERFMALAVELEPVREGKKIKAVNVAMREFTTREGEEKEVPQIGLIIQGAKNFFSYLGAYDEREELSDASFEVQREGGSTDTKYHFFPINAVPDLTDVEIPTLESIIERMGSEEKYENDLEGVEPGSQKQWGKDNKKKSNSKASSGAKAQPSGNLRSQFEQIAQEVKASNVASYDEE